MGAGKTTVGRSLAKRLSKTFLDSDHEIEERTGVRVSIIFEIEGEAGFRKREADTLAKLVQLENVVLATGGGAILDPQTRVGLKEHGCVIYLHARPAELAKRRFAERQRFAPALRASFLRAQRQFGHRRSAGADEAIEELQEIKDFLVDPNKFFAHSDVNYLHPNA